MTLPSISLMLGLALTNTSFAQQNIAVERAANRRPVASPPELTPPGFSQPAAMPVIVAEPSLLLIPDAKKPRVMAFDPETAVSVEPGFVAPDTVNQIAPVSAGADLSLSQSLSSATIAIGEASTLRLEVRNPDQFQVATGVQVISDIPMPIIMQANNCGAIAEGNLTTWTIGTLPPLSRIVCVFQLRSDGLGSIVLSSALSSSSKDAGFANNNSQKKVDVVAVQLPFASRITFSILAGLITLIASIWLFALKD